MGEIPDALIQKGLRLIHHNVNRILWAEIPDALIQKGLRQPAQDAKEWPGNTRCPDSKGI